MDADERSLGPTLSIDKTHNLYIPEPKAAPPKGLPFELTSNAMQLL
jgi:hypothetical protein